MSKVETIRYQGEAIRVEAAHRARFSYHTFTTWPPQPATVTVVAGEAA
jgi:hypothetical protein